MKGLSNMERSLGTAMDVSVSESFVELGGTAASFAEFRARGVLPWAALSMLQTKITFCILQRG